MQNNKKALRTLTIERKNWLEQRKEAGWTRPFSNIERGRFNRIRKLAQKELEDLSLMATSLPEDQLKKIFTVKTLESFFRTILTSNPTGVDQIVENRRAWDLAILIIKIAEESAWQNIKAIRDRGLLSAQRREYEKTRTIRTLDRFMNIET